MEHYVNLNTHSNYTACETVMTPEDIVSFAVKEGATAVALTDRDSVHGFADFSRAAAKHKGFKPIYGVQIYCLTGEYDPVLITLLAKNQTGIRNMYKIITAGYMKLRETSQWPCVSKQDVEENREGLFVGMDLRWADVYSLPNGTDADLSALEENLKLADYIGIIPLDQDTFTNDKGWNADADNLKNRAKNVVFYLEKNGRYPVAVNRSNCSTKEDELCFDILRDGSGDIEKALMKSTAEMLRDYMFLGEELAEKLIIKNPNIIAKQISEDIVVDEPGTGTIEIQDAMQAVEGKCNEALSEKYGNNPPEEIRERLDKELGFIQKSDVASYYVVASKLANKCDEMGYLHTIRGCGGGAFVAYLMKITETNPLPPHYYCPTCGKVEFVDATEFPSGYDLLYSKKTRICPECGESMTGDGQNIPCEFFMGYDGEKLPDFDFNFSEEVYQDIIDCLDETFGSDKVFYAGRMATVNDRLAQGMLTTYYDDKEIRLDPRQRNSLVGRLSKVVRDTGRYPGSLVIVPKDKDIYDFCPLGFGRSKWGLTEGEKPATQIDYHRLALEKIDVLCHSMPTSLKHMETYSRVPAKDIDISQIDISQIDISDFFVNDNLTGLLFFTEFLKNVLETVKPATYSELLKIFGFWHGTGVWQGNAEDLIHQSHDVADTIAFREDVMLYLLEHGVEHKHAFSIAEKVRKGAFERTLSEEEEIDLKEHDIPEWYIKSMKKIRYLIPKSHSDGYLRDYLRMIWYKLYYPEAFFAATLSSDE